jgi:hypothetical protein
VSGGGQVVVGGCGEEVDGLADVLPGGGYADLEPAGQAAVGVAVTQMGQGEQRLTTWAEASPAGSVLVSVPADEAGEVVQGPGDEMARWFETTQVRLRAAASIDSPVGRGTVACRTCSYVRYAGFKEAIVGPLQSLLVRPALTQAALAELTHLSQPRISQILKALAGAGLVEKIGGGWAPRDLDGLLRHWLDTYPGPGGVSTYWSGLDAPRDQAKTVIRRLSRDAASTSATGEPAAVVSGDVAADLIAPWRTPIRAVIYARAGADLTEDGFTPVGNDEATLELVVPHDSGVWSQGLGRQAGRTFDALPTAGPLQVLWDLMRAPGPDRAEAVAALWEVLREQSRSIHATGAA